MPICPLAVAAMLACARIGAVHSVLFSRFALVDNGHEQRNKLLKERIAEARVVITANTTTLNGIIFNLKESLDEAVTNSSVKHVLVFKRTDDKVSMKSGRDEFLEEAMQTQSTECKPELMESEDDLFVMFTSGLTGEPKGVIHTQAGYLLHVAVTHKYYFDYQPGEIYACTADIGWITGHSYVVYGPLCNGATTMLFDSTAVHPNASRYLELVQEHHINQLYTTPSVIQKLMSLDAEIPDSFNLSSLRIIGSVGECLKPEAWKWFHRRFGRCPVMDTWWQTELGGIALSPHPHQKTLDCKIGTSMKPSFGVIPCLIDEEIEQMDNDVTGKLYLEAALPGMGRRLTGDNGYELFREEYFKCHEERTLFYTSDIVHRNKDGDYQIYGRFGDAIRYQGELLNLPVIEGAANSSHESIEDTLLVTQEKQNTSEEPNVFALVKVKGNTLPETEKEVIINVQQKIEETTPIQKDKLEVKTHRHNTCITFSGKTLRQPLKNIVFEKSCHDSKGVEMASRMMPPCLVA